MERKPEGRLLEIGELVKVWPQSSSNWVLGTVMHRTLTVEWEHDYTVVTAEHGTIYPGRSSIWVDDEEPINPWIPQAFSNAAFPVIKKVMPNLLASSLVSVQPMTMPTGLIFYMKYKYLTKEESEERAANYDPNSVLED